MKSRSLASLRMTRFARDDRRLSFIPMPAFSPPDFSKLDGAQEAKFVPAPADGVLPEGFFSSTNLPTYVHRKGKWSMPREPRMDSAIVLGADGDLCIREGRRVKKGDLVAVGQAEDGSEGIFVHSAAFMGEEVDRKSVG